MISQTDLSNTAAYDVKGMDGLRQSAKAKDPAALKEAATQFEAMFINMMMKSMREASPQDGIMDSQQSKMYTSMLDQQTSQNLAKRGTGLADVLIRQLSSSNQALAADGAEAPSPRSSSSVTMASMTGRFEIEPTMSPVPSNMASHMPMPSGTETT